MTSLSPSQSPHQSAPSISISYGADDAELAKVLSAKNAAVTLMARAFRFIVAVQTSGTWSGYSGELGTSTYAAFVRFATQGLLRHADWPDTLGDRPSAVPVAVFLPGTPMNKADLSAWDKQRKSFLGLGRGPNLNTAAKDEILKDAANVCMFKGCGERVDKIGRSARAGNVGQLAHIVGADPLGPRGRDDSHALADKAENVMLVCYDHHRLIDAIDPDAYPIATLQDMRREHMQRVNSLLSQLAWKRAIPLVIRGGIAGQQAALTFREISEALETENLGALHPNGEHLTMAPIERPETNYGFQVLSQIKPEIHRMITACQSGAYSPSQDNLAVFAIHDIPVLVLAGRLVGEARTAQVFQRTRGAQSPWLWQAPHKVTSDVVLNINVHGSPKKGAAVGLLTIGLSDSYQDTWITDTTRQSIAAETTTWIAVSAQRPNANIVASRCDLELIMTTIRESLRRLQGDFQVHEVHLLIVAPVSVAFSIGQALQAGNHLPTTVFHRVNASKPFEPAFKIFSNRVENADGAPTVSVQLQ